MLHVILTILKIIGILILVVVALLVLVSGVVLFVPIRYRVKGEKEEESFWVKADVYWLFHMFRIKALYPEPGRTVAKFLWFTLYDSKQEDKPEKKTKKRKEKKSKKEKDRPAGPKERTEEKSKSEDCKSIEKKKQDDVPTEEKQIESEGQQDRQEKENREKGVIGRICDKMKEIIRLIFNILKNIKYTIRRVCDKIKEIWSDIHYYTEVFQEEETKRAFTICKQQLYKIWKNIRPSKCMAELKVGTGEPDTTGYILALHGMLYPYIGNTVTIEPDFDNQVLEGHFLIKGRITVFVLLRAAIKLYFNDDIKYFLRRFKREEA